MTFRATLHYLDLLIRVLVGVSLAPLALFTLFLAVMAGDSPHSGSPSATVLGIGACIIGILWLSCAHPDRIARKLERYMRHARWIVRAPTYVYAPFGLYYSERFLFGIAANLFR